MRKDKRHIWLMVIGALIVFIGYFVREHYMDEAKANEGRLQSALEMEHVLLSIKGVRLLIEQQRSPSIKVIDEESERKQMRYLTDTLDDQRVTFMEATILTPLLPKEDPALMRLHDDAKDKLNAAARLEVAAAASDLKHAQDDPKVAATILSYTSAVKDSVMAVGMFYTSSLAEAGKAHKEEQRNLKTLTVLEYCCFVIGWLLGVIGKFIGADVETADA